MKITEFKKLIREEVRKVLKEATLKDLIKPLTTELESMGYDVTFGHPYGFAAMDARKILRDGSVLGIYLTPSETELRQKNYVGSAEKFSTIDVNINHWSTEVTKKLFGLYKQKNQVLNRLTDKEGQDIDLGSGMFDIPIEQSVTKVIGLVKKAEAKAATMK